MSSMTKKNWRTPSCFTLNRRAQESDWAPFASLENFLSGENAPLLLTRGALPYDPGGISGCREVVYEIFRIHRFFSHSCNTEPLMLRVSKA